MYAYEPVHADVNSFHYRSRLVDDIRNGRFPTRRGHLSQLQTILGRMSPYHRSCLKAELRSLLPQDAYLRLIGKRAYFRAFDGLSLAVTDVAVVG